jgi:predicted NUDIX family phosphoesterase
MDHIGLEALEALVHMARDKPQEFVGLFRTDLEATQLERLGTVFLEAATADVDVRETKEIRWRFDERRRIDREPR